MPDLDPRELARRATFAAFGRDGVRRWVRVDGTSMLPLIAPGGWLLVDFTARRPRVGSVVLAAVDGRTVAHRIVAAPTARRGDRYVAKGDSERRADARLHQEDIFGTVRAVRRAGGRVSAVGCEGAAAYAIAVTSRLTGRLGRLEAGLTRSVPGPIGSFLGAGIALAVQAPVFVLAITALIGASIESTREGGDTNGEV